MLYPTAEDFLARRARYLYGRRGTPTSEALEDALRALEGPDCAGVALLPSGLAAISTALLAVLNAGDHLLVTDSVYQPTRKFCDGMLKRYGVATTYYDPLIGGGIAALIQPNTRAVFVEAPGSLSFEIQDIPAIAAAAHAKGAVVLMDNTWATPLYFRAFEKGVDLSIQAATKYIGGHSDVMLGTVSANKATWERLADTVHALGLCVGPDDVYLGLRGLRTMGVRLAQHHQAGLKVARWLASGRKSPACSIPRSKAVPAMPSGGAISPVRADCSASCSSRSRRPQSTRFSTSSACSASARHGAASRAWRFPSTARPIRTATKWAPGGPTVRIHIGLEDIDDLIGDLERGFAAFAAARVRRMIPAISNLEADSARSCQRITTASSTAAGIRFQPGDSLRLDIGSPDHARPGLGFRPRAAGEFLRRAGDRFEAERSQALLDIAEAR